MFDQGRPMGVGRGRGGSPLLVGGQGKSASGQDPLRRKVMSALAGLVDKHRRVLEEHEQVVITIRLDWGIGKIGIRDAGCDAN